MTIKTRVKIKSRSQMYEINRPRPRHGKNILNIKCIAE